MIRARPKPCILPFAPYDTGVALPRARQKKPFNYFTRNIPIRSGHGRPNIGIRFKWRSATALFTGNLRFLFGKSRKSPPKTGVAMRYKRATRFPTRSTANFQPGGMSVVAP